MPAKPIGERGLADPPAGDTFHHLNRIHGIEAETLPVLGQEQAGNNPGGTFVPVDEAVIFRQAIGIGCGKIRRVRVAMAREVDRMGQCRFNRPEIANTIRPTMLGELPVMDRKHDTRFNPIP